MDFSHDLTYDAPISDVRAMLATPAFREQVCDAMHARNVDIDIDGSGSGMTVKINQTQPSAGIPSFAKKIVGDDIPIEQRESWSSATNASLQVSIPGKPGDFTGTIELSESGGTTTETVNGTIKVKIPLVGRKLEGLIADMLRAALKSEGRVGWQWLADHD